MRICLFLTKCIIRIRLIETIKLFTHESKTMSQGINLAYI